MQKLTMEDIRPIDVYELDRHLYRKSVLEHKRNRRVSIGPDITVTFEDRTTMTFQIQEMMRAETMVDDGPIREELAVYNTLIPDSGELSATLFIEITEESEIKERLHQFIGLTDGGRFWLQIGEHRADGEFEGDRSTVDQISSVHYVRFKVDAEATRALAESTNVVTLCIDQGDYKHDAILGESVRKSLLDDLTTE